MAAEMIEAARRGDVDVLYLAVPHNLHEDLYVAAAQAGRDYLGEKPFGIDLAASRRMAWGVWSCCSDTLSSSRSRLADRIRARWAGVRCSPPDGRSGTLD